MRDIELFNVWVKTVPEWKTERWNYGKLYERQKEEPKDFSEFASYLTASIVCMMHYTIIKPNDFLNDSQIAIVLVCIEQV